MILNSGQTQALEEIQAFLASDADVFVLSGSAGTGKSTLIREICGLVESVACLAPTGRAARVLGERSGVRGRTLHSYLYTYEDTKHTKMAISQHDGGVRLTFALRKEEVIEPLIIVDEASMVGLKKQSEGHLVFGTGSVLKDLCDFAFRRRSKSKIIFVGDPYQLPPVREATSPVFHLEDLADELGHVLVPRRFELLEVMRQEEGSAILDLATSIREQLMKDEAHTLNIQEADGAIFESKVGDHVSRCVSGGKFTTPVITYSNHSALDFNRLFRELRWGNADDPIHAGDQLMVVKNDPATGLLNGDVVEAVLNQGTFFERRIRVKTEKDGEIEVRLTFGDVAIRNQDVDFGQRRVLLNLLASNARALAPLEMRALYEDAKQRYRSSTGSFPRTDSEEWKTWLAEDEDFSALHLKYGYAFTCHKAQGGEWERVLVNFSDLPNALCADGLRWAYTAITRASEVLLVASPPTRTRTSDIARGGAPAPSAVATIDDPRFEEWGFAAGQEPLFHQLIAIIAKLKTCAVDCKSVHHPQYELRLGGIETRLGPWDLRLRYNGRNQITVVEVLKPRGHQELENLAREIRTLSAEAETEPAPEESEMVLELKAHHAKSVHLAVRDGCRDYAQLTNGVRFTCLYQGESFKFIQYIRRGRFSKLVPQSAKRSALLERLLLDEAAEEAD